MQKQISQEIRLTTFLYKGNIMYSCQLIGYFKDGGGHVRERTLVNKGYERKSALLKFVDKHSITSAVLTRSVNDESKREKNDE